MKKVTTLALLLLTGMTIASTQTEARVLSKFRNPNITFQNMYESSSDDYYWVSLNCLYQEGVIDPAPQNQETYTYKNVKCEYGYTSFYYEQKWKAEGLDYKKLSNAEKTKYLEDMYLGTMCRGNVDRGMVQSDSNEDICTGCRINKNGSIIKLVCGWTYGSSIESDITSSLNFWISKMDAKLTK